MSWDGAEWAGPLATEIQVLVSATARPAGGRRTVPVHVQCSGGHDTRARVRLALAGEGLKLEPRGGEIFTAVDDDVAEELSEIDPETPPPLRVLCLDCGAEGQGLAVHRLLEMTLEALGRWLDPNKSPGPFPRFVWPKA
ncbi:hypothetical protein J2S64_003766 [Paeniglutamicibacter sulfureus]|uniref:Uncharacterized protein n=1 Tax=Paeniglutamicibacter sulfureus TaxID=43666 RepID=A0ABU2BN67_9MICC|nr:hypothetical protein [Paeniglutamicibacter sulfureus]